MTTEEMNEDLRQGGVLPEEKGEDGDGVDIFLSKKEIAKKAQEFVKEHYDKYITKKKPKTKQQTNK